MYVLAIIAALSTVGAASSATAAPPATEIRRVMTLAAVWLAVITVALSGLILLEGIR